MSEFEIGSAIEQSRQQRLAERADDEAFRRWYANDLAIRNGYIKRHTNAAEALIRGYAAQTVGVLIGAGLSPSGRILAEQEKQLRGTERDMTSERILLAVHRYEIYEGATSDGYEEFASKRHSTATPRRPTVTKHLWMSLSDGEISASQRELLEAHPIVHGVHDPANQPAVLVYRNRLTAIGACLLDARPFTITEDRVVSFAQQ